jgi:hypothetical protein
MPACRNVFDLPGCEAWLAANRHRVTREAERSAIFCRMQFDAKKLAVMGPKDLAECFEWTFVTMPNEHHETPSADEKARIGGAREIQRKLLLDFLLDDLAEGETGPHSIAFERIPGFFEYLDEHGDEISLDALRALRDQWSEFPTKEYRERLERRGFVDVIERALARHRQ